jgi:hypothetical protein
VIARAGMFGKFIGVKYAEGFISEKRSVSAISTPWFNMKPEHHYFIPHTQLLV